MFGEVQTQVVGKHKFFDSLRGRSLFVSAGAGKAIVSCLGNGYNNGGENTIKGGMSLAVGKNAANAVQPAGGQRV